MVFDVVELRHLLIGCAKAHRTVTYSEVAAHFGYDWSLSVGSALYGALGRLGEENRSRNEPLLMALVVAKQTGMPGSGFYATIGASPADPVVHEARIECVYAYNWSGSQ